jgi:hypothetical protein
VVQGTIRAADLAGFSEHVRSLGLQAESLVTVGVAGPEDVAQSLTLIAGFVLGAFAHLSPEQIERKLNVYALQARAAGDALTPRANVVALPRREVAMTSATKATNQSADTPQPVAK